MQYKRFQDNLERRKNSAALRKVKPEPKDPFEEEEEEPSEEFESPSFNVAPKPKKISEPKPAEVEHPTTDIPTTDNKNYEKVAASSSRITYAANAKCVTKFHEGFEPSVQMMPNGNMMVIFPLPTNAQYHVGYNVMHNSLTYELSWEPPSFAYLKDLEQQKSKTYNGVEKPLETRWIVDPKLESELQTKPNLAMRFEMEVYLPKPYHVEQAEMVVKEPFVCLFVSPSTNIVTRFC